MNTLKRLIFGILSSLLLAAGFAHAADRLDPMTQSLHSAAGILHDGEGGGETPADEQVPIGPPCAGGGSSDN